MVMGEMFPNSMRTVPAAAGGGAVSILMRTRDRPILLARALSSVLAQTYADWHLRLVNDGGEVRPVDAITGEYAAAFAGRISVVHHPHSLGMEAASNTALAGSSGDFVCLHDDDDSWHPDFLAATTQFLREPAHARFAAVVTRTTFVFERLEAGGIVVESRKPDTRLAGQPDYATMLGRNQFPPISQLIRRTVVDAIGAFNEALPVLGDWDYNLRILRLGDIGLLPRRLSYYHHRRADELAPYGNSVIAAAARHDEVRTLYRNSMMRRLAETSPEGLGLVHVVLQEAGQNQEALLAAAKGIRGDLLQRSYDTDLWNGWRHADLRDRLVRIETELAELQRGLAGIRAVSDRLAAVLDRASPAWRRLLPARRLLARLRGRA